MIDLIIDSQPDDESCGPTCLHAIYQYYGLKVPLDEIVTSVERSFSGGTISPLLGKHALQRGFDATLYVYNLLIFDPTWFAPENYSKETLMDKLRTQLEYKPDIYLAKSTHALLDFLSLGGKICFQTLSMDLLKPFFKKNIPIITGLSATYLYRSPRERYTQQGQSIYDDIRGTPCGHFVVLCGYDSVKKLVDIADPHKENLLSKNNHYQVGRYRLLNSIMLGVLTYDANLLMITPKRT
jgi:hypothetical protein